MTPTTSDPVVPARLGPPQDVPQELHGWRRAVAFPLELLIRLYRILISPLLGNVCRFYPTCSSYGLTAVRRFGLLRGSWLIITRLIRCHPWNPGGVDHVPWRGPDGRPMRHNEASPRCAHEPVDGRGEPLRGRESSSVGMDHMAQSTGRVRR